MKSEFAMTGLGKLDYFLGMEFLETERDLVMHKMKYASEILKKFEMIECNSIVSLKQGSKLKVQTIRSSYVQTIN